MTTARDIIESAWRRITVSASDESVPAADAEDLLEVFNDYLFSLRARDAAYTHYRLSLNSDIQLQDELVGALKSVLAMRGAEFFGMGILPGLAQSSKQADRLIVGSLMTPIDLTTDIPVKTTNEDFNKL